MRLFTHNLLQCHVKNCTKNNYPLRIQEAEIEEIEAEFNSGFVTRLIPKLDWAALISTLNSVNK